MVYANRPLTGREYKLMLNTNEFKERDEGIKNFLDLIESRIKLLNSGQGREEEIRFEEKVKEKKRTVWYMDTKNFELNANKFLLRVRRENDEEYITDLKSRNPDRYISASYDFSSTTKDDIKIKFEEDIISPFVSKFSLSASFKTQKEPRLESFNEIRSIFPGLNSLNIDGDKKVKKVNDFEAKEISYSVGKIISSEGSTDDTSLNFWYLPDEGKKATPLIVEFAYDYAATQDSNDSTGSAGKLSLEQFPVSFVILVNSLFYDLQKGRFVDLNTTRTKTEYAYQYGHKKPK